MVIISMYVKVLMETPVGLSVGCKQIVPFLNLYSVQKSNSASYFGVQNMTLSMEPWCNAIYHGQ